MSYRSQRDLAGKDENGKPKLKRRREDLLFDSPTLLCHELSVSVDGGFPQDCSARFVELSRC